MAEPLISVITPTWRRHDLLLGRCVPSVRLQDYPAVEHVVVSDGPDPDLAARMAAEAPDVVFAELGEHDPGARWGHHARLHGIGLAAGDLIAYLDDDNEFRPQHLSAVAAALQADGAGFAYSQALFHQEGAAWVVGAQPPSYGQIDTSVIVHRRELLPAATWRDEGQETVDWDLVHRWLQAGATWAFHQEITVDYHVT
jgi:glycosyltransferase involved in cell wall biosynthesis